MKQTLIIFSILSITSCGKTTDTELKKGKVLFYSDVFVATNCIVDSVSIYIDDEYKGKLTSSFMPLSEVPTEKDTNVFVTELLIGQHSYAAKISGCNSNQWTGTLNVDEASCEKINLNLSTSKP
ncbi:MAG: hypothetical protein QM642_04895 [Edaphocola sp.]